MHSCLSILHTKQISATLHLYRAVHAGHPLHFHSILVHSNHQELTNFPDTLGFSQSDPHCHTVFAFPQVKTSVICCSCCSQKPMQRECGRELEGKMQPHQQEWAGTKHPPDSSRRNLKNGMHKEGINLAIERGRKMLGKMKLMSFLSISAVRNCWKWRGRLKGPPEASRDNCRMEVSWQDYWQGTGSWWQLEQPSRCDSNIPVW